MNSPNSPYGQNPSPQGQNPGSFSQSSGPYGQNYRSFGANPGQNSDYGFGPGGQNQPPRQQPQGAKANYPYGSPSGYQTNPNQFGAQPIQPGGYGAQPNQPGGYGAPPNGPGDPANPNDDYGNDGGGKNYVGWIIGAAVLVIVIAVAGIFLLRGSESDGDNNAADSTQSSSNASPSSSSKSTSSSTSPKSPSSSSTKSSTTASAAANPKSIVSAAGKLQMCSLDRDTKLAMKINSAQTQSSDSDNILETCLIHRTPENADIHIVSLDREPEVSNQVTANSDLPGWSTLTEVDAITYLRQLNTGWVGVMTPVPEKDFHGFVKELDKLFQDAGLI